MIPACFLAGGGLLKGLTRIFTDGTDQEQARASATAGPFGRLRAGSSTSLLTKCVSNFAQDDKSLGAPWGARTTARAEADSFASLRKDNRERRDAGRAMEFW